MNSALRSAAQLSFLWLVLSSPFAHAQQRTAPYIVDQGLSRDLVSVDYNSWFEKLTIIPAAGPRQDSKAFFYGFGVNYERNWYHPSWGWGLGAGALTGRALGGEKNGALSYFEPRVPWWALRVSPRIFYRWNPQADFGIDLAGLYKNITWPDKSGNSEVKSGSTIVAGAFFDVRVRFNAKLEMIQSFGVLYKDESTYWRMGLAYRL